MRIYNIHNRRPEWLENPSAHKEEMKDIAHDYVMDLLKVVPDMRNNILLSDLNSMIDERTSIIDLWEFDEDPKNAQERYTQDKAKCFIIENLLKFILCYMRRYNYHLDAIEIYAFIECRYAYELDFINSDDLPVIRPSAEEDFADINFDDECKKNYKKAYYDFSFTIESAETEDAEGFLLMGAKNKNGTNLVWNNNNTTVTDEEDK